MSTCPKCRLVITELLWKSRPTHSGAVGLDSKGEVEYDDDTDMFQETGVEYSCPECRQVLFDNSCKAEEFLINGADKC